MYHFADVIGFIGVFFVLLCYFMAQTEYWKNDDYAFLLGNLIGSLCVIFSLFFHWNISAFIIEFAWTVITAYSLIKKIIKNN